MANLTILAGSQQRPERHEHCRVRDDGVPVLQVEPIRSRLRQLRVVVQELEQDDDKVVTPRPDPRHCGHEQNENANLGKKPTDKRKKEEGTFHYMNISGEGIILYYSFTLIQKNHRRVKSQTLQFYLNSKKIKSAPRQICNYFRSDGMCLCVVLCGGMCCHRCFVGCVSVGVDALAVLWW